MINTYLYKLIGFRGSYEFYDDNSARQIETPLIN